MIVRWMRPGLMVGLSAAGILAFAASASAFTRENVLPDGGNYSFSDPDAKPTGRDELNAAPGTRPFGSNGPVVQFGVQQGPVSTFGQGNRQNMPDPYFGALKGN